MYMVCNLFWLPELLDLLFYRVFRVSSMAPGQSYGESSFSGMAIRSVNHEIHPKAIKETTTKQNNFHSLGFSDLYADTDLGQYRPRWRPLPDGKRHYLSQYYYFINSVLSNIFWTANNKDNTKTPHHWSFAKGIHRDLLDSIRKGKHFHVVTSLWLLSIQCIINTWWSHQMGTFYALLALCAGNSSVTGKG